MTPLNNGLHVEGCQSPSLQVTQPQALRQHCYLLQDGSTPLHYAAAFGQTHVLETLVQAGVAVDSRDDACNTPLHLAAGGHCTMA